MTDQEITRHIRHLLSAEHKPHNLEPIDLLQTVRLLVQGADEKDLYLSQSTLATQLCCSTDYIQKSQQRLRKKGWLIVRKGGARGRTNLYQVDLTKLPTADLSKTVVSDEARKLAVKYKLMVRQHGRKVPKGREQQWSFTLQKLVSRSKTKANWQGLAAILTFAFAHPKFQKPALMGPDRLKPRHIWDDLVANWQQWATAQQSKAS